MKNIRSVLKILDTLVGSKRNNCNVITDITLPNEEETMRRITSLTIDSYNLMINKLDQDSSLVNYIPIQDILEIEKLSNNFNFHTYKRVTQ